MYCVTVEQSSRILRLSAHPGETALSLLQRNGLFLPAACGGSGRCGRCTVEADGRQVLACRYVIEGDCSLCLPPSPADSGIHLHTSSPPSRFAFAVDFGTTTLAVSLVDCDRESPVATLSQSNRQRTFGADILSRLRYGRNKEGLLTLQRMGLEQLREMIETLSSSFSLSPRSAEGVTVAGNTAMLFLLRGLDVSPLMTPPYTFRQEDWLNIVGADWQPPHWTGAPLSLLPPVGGFVGSDIAAAAFACGIGQGGETALLYDLGTNGEIVLSHGGELYCCSTAAGSAFEGVGIQCGVGGVPGAIRKVWRQEDRLRWETIQDLPPVGLTASGLLDTVALLLESGLVSETGRLSPSLEKQFPVTDDILLTQSDIREIQLAKAAVAAGAFCLTRREGVSFDEVDRVMLAGVFGANLQIPSAATIGLISPTLASKTTAVGNAALQGTAIAASGQEQFDRVTKLCRRMRWMDLSGEEGFEEEFLNQINFPQGVDKSDTLPL